jgi:membrane-associated phospholipid phosphatase
LDAKKSSDGKGLDVKEQGIPASLPAQMQRNLLWAGAIVGLLCLCLFVFGDKQMALFLHSAKPRLTIFHKIADKITVLGNSALYLIPTLIFYLAHRIALPNISNPANRDRIVKLGGFCLFLFAAVMLSGLLTDLLKIFFGRARPNLLFHHEAYSFYFFQFSSRMWSFPSGHANTIFTLATACYLVQPRGWFLYFFLAALVAASRVFIGAHYPSDVIMGAYLGVLTTIYLKQYFLYKGINIFSTDKLQC